MIRVLCFLVLLTGCAGNTTKTEPDPPLVAACDERCLTECDLDSVRWVATGDEPRDWDTLIKDVIPALKKSAADCEIQRRACVRCLSALESTNRVCGLTGPCSVPRAPVREQRE